MASSCKSPVIATPLPRPHKAFSLNVGVGARDWDSYDTRRTEFEPMSTIANGSPGKRPGAAFSGMDDPAGGRTRPLSGAPGQRHWKGVHQRFAATRQARIGHEIFVRIERLFPF